MPIRLPRVSRKTVKVTCELNTDVQTELEAYAAFYEAHHHETITIPELITGIVGDYLRRDPDFMRERRQAAVAPRARPTTASAAPRPSGPERRNGPISQPGPRTPGEGDGS
ncbi:MAG: DUF2274 domain-containing protein [Candidatus Tectimicrobiota bacterium]